MAASVNVVIPCYNYGRYLCDCVGSVLQQSGVAVRALIIDDASTDGSASVAADIAAADPRVEFRGHAVNHGHIRTYNEGLQWVTATYSVLLSPDDMLTPGSLQRACALLDAHPEVGFAYGRALVFAEGHPRPQPRTGPGRWRIWPGSEWLERRCRTTDNCIYCPEVVVRSRLLQELGGYRQDLPHTADLELWMRLALHADVGYIAGPHQAYYRNHGASMRHQQFHTPLAELAQFVAAFEVLFRDHGHRIAERARLEQMARRMLARRALRAACQAYEHGKVNPMEVAALEQLAATTYGDAHTLGEGRGLQWRKRWGPQVCPLLQPFMVVSLVQRIGRGLRRRRLQRAGL